MDGSMTTPVYTNQIPGGMEDCSTWLVISECSDGVPCLETWDLRPTKTEAISDFLTNLVQNAPELRDRTRKQKWEWAKRRGAKAVDIGIALPDGRIMP